jgi:putative peptide zinc metalloprotease protein
LIVFAWLTWINRLVVFLGIAALVYFSFFKLLGLFLFGVEIVWFVLSPILGELREWRKRWPEIRQRSRKGFSAALALCLVLLTVTPWPGRISASAILHPAEVWPVFAPSGARVRELNYADGDEVPAGAPLLSLYVPDLAMRSTTLQVKLEQSRWQAAASGLDEESRKRLLVHEQNLASAQAEMAGLRTEQSQYVPRAPFTGRLRDLDPDLQVGEWVSRKEKLAILVKEDGRWLLETWLDESAVQRLRQGDKAIFSTDSVFGPVIKASIASIDLDASRILPRVELSTLCGGHILTRPKNGQLIPESAIYRVTLLPDFVPVELAHQSWRGRLVLHARWEAPASRYVRQGVTVLIRELGF